MLRALMSSAGCISQCSSHLNYKRSQVRAGAPRIPLRRQNFPSQLFDGSTQNWVQDLISWFGCIFRMDHVDNACALLMTSNDLSVTALTSPSAAKRAPEGIYLQLWTSFYFDELAFFPKIRPGYEVSGSVHLTDEAENWTFFVGLTWQEEEG